MACARRTPLATGLGRGTLASGLLRGLVPAPAADFPGVEELRARAEMPNPLVVFDGRPVTRAEEWFARRRPELKALTLVGSTLGDHIRRGTHPMGREDWALFLEYADTRFGRTTSR